MKKILPFILLIFISISVMGQITFNWESQLIKEGYNMKEMDVVNDTNTILAGYGNTFVRTKDQGTSWEKVPLIDPEFDWADISMNSSGLGYAIAGDVKVVDNPSGAEPDVYADGVLLKTTDFGVTWSVSDITKIGVSEDDPADYPAADGCYASHFRAVEVLEDNTVFLSAEWKSHDGATGESSSQRGTLKSTDGENWTAITDNGYYSLCIEAGPSGIYYGGLNHLFRAEAGNDNVTDIYTALTTAAADETVFVSDVTMGSEGLVYVITSTNGIFVTGNNGDSFELLENGAPGGGNDMILVNDTVWMVLGSSSKSMLTRDSGATWEDCYPGATCYEIGGIFNDSIIGLGKSDIHKLAVSDAISGNYTWTSQEINPGNNMQKMHIVDANTAIIAGYGNTLVRTTDGGITWNSTETPGLHVFGALYDFESISTSGTASFAITRRLYVVDFPSSSPYSDLYAHGLIYKTTDNWQTWEMLDYLNVGSGTDQAFNPNAEGCYGMNPYELACVNETVAYMYVNWLDTIAGLDNKLSHGNIFLTKDGGDSWEALFNDMGNTYINHIWVKDPQTVYIIGNTFFRMTEDGGETFTDLYPAFQETGSPNDSTIFLKRLEYIDENTWYLLSSVDGVFVTTDGGVNYSTLPSIGGGGGFKLLNDSTIIVLGSSTKSKISWDYGMTWENCYPGSTIWEIGGILDGKLIGLAKSNIYKIPLTDLEAPGRAADILSFVLTEQTGDAIIDVENTTITIEVQPGTDPSALTPTITVSEGASLSPASGTAQDFSDTVTYTVKSEDLKTTVEWNVIVTVAVGIQDYKTAVSLYPNPVASTLYLGNLEMIDRVMISNITGGTVLQKETPGNVTAVDMGAFENGIYFISLTGKDGSVTARKFIVRK